jgi:hypothetical protein
VSYIKKLTKEQIKLILANTKATLAIEGLESSQEIEQISYNHLARKITEEESLKAIYEIVKRMY